MFLKHINELKLNINEKYFTIDTNNKKIINEIPNVFQNSIKNANTYNLKKNGNVI